VLTSVIDGFSSCLGSLLPNAAFSTGIKKPAEMQQVFLDRNRSSRKLQKLLQLDFLIFDMLASLGVELHDQHLVGRGLLVFGGGVEVTGAGSGFQLDFFACAFCHDAAP
jgi:hypothetical protein